jgi:glycosyltransferase involved in cell wall biosynthesis
LHWPGFLSRGDVASIVSASEACIVPHRRNQLTEAMSPLKLYEYLAAGRPVVTPDLEPTRGVHEKVIRVSDDDSFGEAVAEALRLGPMDDAERQAFIRANAWSTRHELILDVALR